VTRSKGNVCLSWQTFTQPPASPPELASLADRFRSECQAHQVQKGLASRRPVVSAISNAAELASPLANQRAIEHYGVCRDGMPGISGGGRTARVQTHTRMIILSPSFGAYSSAQAWQVSPPHQYADQRDGQRQAPPTEVAAYRSTKEHSYAVGFDPAHGLAPPSRAC